MTERVYLDTSIWRDYFEDRKDNLRPLGEFAFQFLKNCKKLNYEIIVSDAVLFELKDFPKNALNSLWAQYKELLLRVDSNKNQIEEAGIISKGRNLPFNHALHAIISRDNKAVLISRDKHFFDLADIVEFQLPEEFTFL